MKRFLLTLIFCIFLTGCGQKSLEQSIEPQTSLEVIPTPVVDNEISETTEENIPISEEIEEEPEEIIYDVIPEVYAYCLTVSINPEVKLYFDASDIIVGVEYKNDDAIDAYAELNLLGTSSKEGLEKMIDAAVEKEYLKEDGQVSIELSEVFDENIITDDSPLTQAQEIISEHIEEIINSFEENSTEETPALLNVNIQVEVAETVTEKTGIVPVVICPDCNGTGNDCKECNGTTIVNCKRCNGGWETCGICNGTGHEICHGCKGSGSDNGNTCTRCGGSGKQDSCTGCGGAGGFNCSWCKGALQHICPECWGEQICKTCGGKGTIN